jgi:hypothetical protein
MPDPKLELVIPAIMSGNPNSLCAKLHPITRKPTSASIAPKIQVSKGNSNLH